MQEPITRHSYVQVNDSLVHLVQYSFHESILRRNSQNCPANPDKSSDDLNSQSRSTTNESCSTSSLNNFPASSTKPSRSNNNNTTTNGISLDDFPPVPAKRVLFSSSNKIIVFVPGNPGVLGIYHDFLTSLFKIITTSESEDRSQLPIILAMGHNNFDHPDHVQYRAEERICVQESELNFVEKAIAEHHANQPHHIDLQVANKLIILKKLLKTNIKDCQLVFIGHSIGCYVILKLLQDKLISSSHRGSILIHPALENLALTRRGSVIKTYFNYKLDLIGQTVALIIDYCLPKTIKLALTRWYCDEKFVNNASSIALESIAQMVCQKTYTALVEMAKSELTIVRDMNPEIMIKPHESKLKLIYAINDGWVNADNKKLLRDSFPNLEIEEQPTLHAFVMDPKTVMDYAIRVANHVQDFFDNID